MCIFSLLAKKFKPEGLESCSYSTGGGMLGGYRRVTLQKDRKGNRTVSLQYKETHADREETTVYPASEEAFVKATEIMKKYHLYAASKRGRSRIQILDGDTTTISFYYKNGDFSIHELQRLSRKMRKGFTEIEDFLDSLLTGDGVTTLEPQEAMLHLKSGYTICFEIEAAFDDRLTGILGVKHEVSRFGEHGIVLCTGEEPDVSSAEPVSGSEGGAAGNIVYDPESKEIILLYEEHAFAGPVYVLAKLQGHLKSAAPLLAEMEGPYAMRFTGTNE